MFGAAGKPSPRNTLGEPYSSSAVRRSQRLADCGGCLAAVAAACARGCRCRHGRSGEVVLQRSLRSSIARPIPRRRRIGGDDDRRHARGRAAQAEATGEAAGPQRSRQMLQMPGPSVPNGFRSGKAHSSGTEDGLDGKANLVLRTADALEPYAACELFSHATLGDPPQRELAHRSC